MNKFTSSDKDRVLKILIKLSQSGIDNIIYKPVSFESNFNFITTESLIEILKILESEGLIEVIYADYPEHFNIYTLQITPKGLLYPVQKVQESKEKWFDRIIGWFLGHFFIIILTLFL